MRGKKKRKSARKRIRIELTRRALAGWGFGLLVALLWMFLLGLFVGKGLTPADINLAQIKERMMEEGIWPGSGKTENLPEKPPPTASAQERIPVKDLGFYEALAEKKKRAQRRSPGQSKTAAPKGAAVSSAPASQPPAPAPASASGRYTVQVASFKNLASARKFSLSLKGLDARTAIRPVDLAGKGRWYRVQVGEIQSFQEASSLADRLSREYQLKAFVMRLDR